MNLTCDIGTTYFRAAVAGTGEFISEPSVVAIDALGHITIGQAAEAMIGRNPREIEVISPFDGGVVRNMDAVIEIVKHCVKTLAPRQWRYRFSLTVSTPSGLTPVELRAIEDAGRAAGAKSLHFVNACVAAAVGVGLPVDNPKGHLVVSLGGGVTEAALLSLRGIVASSVIRSGGKEINGRLLERIRKDYSLLVGDQTIESVKRQLCSDGAIPECEIRGRDLVTGLPQALAIPRSLVDDEIEAYCAKLVELIGGVISKCPPELAGDIIEEGVILVGGGAHIGAVAQKLSSKLEAPVVVAEDPEASVIRGLSHGSWSIKSRRRA